MRHILPASTDDMLQGQNQDPKANTLQAESQELQQRVAMRHILPASTDDMSQGQNQDSKANTLQATAPTRRIARCTSSSRAWLFHHCSLHCADSWPVCQE